MRGRAHRAEAGSGTRDTGDPSAPIRGAPSSDSASVRLAPGLALRRAASHRHSHFHSACSILATGAEQLAEPRGPAADVGAARAEPPVSAPGGAMSRTRRAARRPTHACRSASSPPTRVRAAPAPPARPRRPAADASRTSAAACAARRAAVRWASSAAARMTSHALWRDSGAPRAPRNSRGVARPLAENSGRARVR